MSDDDTVRRWAKVKSELKESSVKVLEANGLTWDSFRELTENAAKQMGDEIVDTEYGWVQRTPKGPITWTARKADEVETKWQLTLLQRREK